MARRNRNRYREFEKKATLIVLADLAVFLLYLLFADQGYHGAQEDGSKRGAHPQAALF